MRTIINREVCNDRGVSMVELIFGVAILLIVVLAVGTTMNSSQKAANSITKNLGYSELLAEVRQTLDSPTQCSTAFNGEVLPAVPPGPAQITLATGTIINDSNHADFGSGQLTISSLRYTSIVAVPGVANAFVATITLKTDTQGTSGTAIVGGGNRVSVFNVILTTTALGAVTGCGAANVTAPPASPTLVDEYWSFTSCAVGSAINDEVCAGVATLPTAMADTTYQVSCAVEETVGSPVGGFSVGTAGLATTGFPYVYLLGMPNGSPALTATLNCHAHHN